MVHGRHGRGPPVGTQGGAYVPGPHCDVQGAHSPSVVAVWPAMHIVVQTSLSQAGVAYATQGVSLRPCACASVHDMGMAAGPYVRFAMRGGASQGVHWAVAAQRDAAWPSCIWEPQLSISAR